MISKFENKWLNGAIPALLIHCCIGSVYCWSLFKNNIAQAMDVSTSSIEISFMLAIFFLGMSAAFGGRFVESNVKSAAFASVSFFVLGLVGTAFAIELKLPLLLYISYGVIMGIGLGIGYITPVKTLMIWFEKYKGVATGIAISGFGLSKVIFSPYIEYMTKELGITSTILSMAAISSICMLAAAFLIKKPKTWNEEPIDCSIKQSMTIILNKKYLVIWLMFFINITCGLVLISFEKNIMQSVGITAIAFFAALTAFFNTFGRFGYASLSDFFQKKVIVYIIIFIISCLACFNVGMDKALTVESVILLLFLINMGYGGGFSTLPTLLTNHFGMKQLSTIHGFALSAWAWASVAAYVITQIFIYNLGYTYQEICNILGILYLVALFGSLYLYNQKEYNNCLTFLM